MAFAVCQFIGGSLDGTSRPMNDTPYELRLAAWGDHVVTPVTEQARVELYVFEANNVYRFKGYSHSLPRGDAKVSKDDLDKVTAACKKLMPLLDVIDAFFKKQGGYCPITLGKWKLIRRDEEE